MAGAWAAEIAKEYARELGRIRLLPGVELAETETSYWVQGTSAIEEAQLALLAIPHVQLYHIERAGLRPWGHRLVEAASVADVYSLGQGHPTIAADRQLSCGSSAACSPHSGS